MTKWNKDIIINHIQDFYNINKRSPVDKDFYKHSIYPNPTTVKKYFGTWNNALEAASVPITKHNRRNNFWTNDLIIKAIKDYHIQYNRIPECRDFKAPLYPNRMSVFRLFGSWNAAIKAAGFQPNSQNSLGVNTKALDGYTYRSKAEAYFVDNFLHNKYEYIIEPKYPEKYNKYYDWYIPSLDLYIELDGGIRPETTNEKRAINKLLQRKCIFIDIANLQKFSTLEDFI
jgi:hypothetical protein